MQKALDNIFTRKSTKKYTEKPVSREDIDTVIKAGISAASGRNLQSAIVVAVTDKATRDALSRANAEILGSENDPFYGAPCVLVVLADKSCRTYLYDGSLVMGNMMLAAHAIGLGSCWVHRAREVFELPEWKKWLVSLGIEGEYEGIGNLILGYPDGKIAEPLPKKEGRVYYSDAKPFNK